MIKYVASLPLETVVDVKGVLVEADVKSCTQVILKGAAARSVYWHMDVDVALRTPAVGTLVQCCPVLPVFAAVSCIFMLFAAL